MHFKNHSIEDSIINKIRESKSGSGLENSIMYGLSSSGDEVGRNVAFRLGSQALQLEEHIYSCVEKIYFDFAVKSYGKERIYRDFSADSKFVIRAGFHVRGSGDVKEYAEVIYTDDIQICKSEFAKFLKLKYGEIYTRYEGLDYSGLDSQKVQFELDVDQLEMLQKITHSISKNTTSEKETIILSALSRHMKNLLKEYSVEYQMNPAYDRIMPKIRLGMDPLFFYQLDQKLEYFRFISIMDKRDEKLEKLYSILRRAKNKSSDSIEYFTNIKIYKHGITDYISKKALELLKRDLQKCIDFKKTLFYIRLACKNPENMVIFIDEAAGEVSFAQSTSEKTTISLFKSYKSNCAVGVNDVYIRDESLVISISGSASAKAKISVGPDIRLYKNYLENQGEFNFYLLDSGSNCLEYDKVRFKLDKNQKSVLIDYLNSEKVASPDSSYKISAGITDEQLVYIMSTLMSELAVSKKRHESLIDYIERRYSISSIDVSNLKLLKEVYGYVSRRYHVDIKDGRAEVSFLN